MSHTIQTHSLRDMAAQDRLGMFRLRAEVFSQRLGWDVTVTDDKVRVTVDLPFMLRVMKGTIEDKINEKLNQLL